MTGTLQGDEKAKSTTDGQDSREARGQLAARGGIGFGLAGLQLAVFGLPCPVGRRGRE